MMADLSEAFAEAMAEVEATPEVTPEVAEAPVDTTSEVDNPDPGITESESENTEAEAESDTPDEGPEPEAEANVLDWEALADQLIPVKVNGEEKLVSLKDYRDGIMMREDYSRKTAELAEARKMAEWAQDVQYSFQQDPEGTLRAFAQAYGIEVPSSKAQPVQQEPEADPYEDWDPDMAQLAKAFDQKLSQVTERYEQELEQLRSQTGQITHERLVQQAQAEMQQLNDQFTQAGLEFDQLGVLQIATENEIPLTEAAMLWAGRNALASGKTQAEASAAAKKAGEVAAEANESERKAAKKRASSAATKKYDAADTPVEQFDTLTDLFKIEMARQGS